MGVAVAQPLLWHSLVLLCGRVLQNRMTTTVKTSFGWTVAACQCHVSSEHQLLLFLLAACVTIQTGRTTE